MLTKITNGRTDLVVDYVAAGNPASTTDPDGISLLQWCAYYGDVSAVRFLMSKGEALSSFGSNLDLNGAAFHGHWQLCQFLIEKGANVNHALPDTGETALHASLAGNDSFAAENVLRVLLAAGANPNSASNPGVETDCFMRDARTKAETPLHRAAAFGTEKTIELLLDSGAKLDAGDMNGDSPLSWASWYRRPDSILRLLCYGDFTIHRDRRFVRECLRGTPQS